MLDSGADINVISEQLVRNLSCRKLKSDKKFNTAVDNQRVSIYFFIFVNIEIGGHRFNVKFYVVSDLHPNVILGLEFLKGQNIVLDFKNKKLHFDPRRQLVLENEINVPPKSEIIVVVKLKGESLPNDVIGLTSASPNLLSTGLMTVKSISKVDNNRVLFGIGNFTDDSIKLSKDCNVGKYVCLSKHDELYNLNTDTSQESTNRICSAKYNVINVRDQIDSSLGEGQINDLQNLINEYEDVFVGKDGKLGKCSLLKHEIEVSEGTRPVRQRAYKIGPKQKEILENMVKDMIDQYIIEESCSPWGATCMLVAKRNNNGYRFVVDFAY